jgi:predicted enzyme related to lactoylglutathione lyase
MRDDRPAGFALATLIINRAAEAAPAGTGYTPQMITGINHVQITVPPGSADRVRQFYGGLLQMPEMTIPPALQKFGLIWFKAGDREIHVGVEDNVNRFATHAHIAYQVSDIVDWRRRLIDAGLSLVEQPKIQGYDRFHFTDPFGNRVEMIGQTD